MRTVTAFEAKTRFGELLKRVGRGEEIVITRHDKPVARIVPASSRSLEGVHAAVRQLSALRLQIARRTRRRAVLSDQDVRSAIEEGRRC